MKFSAVVLSLALAASQTSAFMAPSPMARSVGPRFSSEMAEETSAPTVATTTTEEDAPGTIHFCCRTSFPFQNPAYALLS